MSALTPFIFANEKDSSPNAPKSRVPWTFAIACCLYYLFAYRGLASATPIFAKLFEGLGVAIPLPTRLLMATYWWLYPVLFVGAATLTIAKQFVPLTGLSLRVANLALIFVGIVLAPLAVLVLYWPMFELILKLQNAK